MKWMLSAALLLLLAGCGPVKPTIMDPSMMSPSTGRYPVSVERGKWAGINSVPLAVFVDGHIAATVGGGQVVTLYLPEGRHTIGVGVSRAPPDSGVASDEIAVDVSPKSKPILETNVSAMGYGGWKISRATQ